VDKIFFGVDWLSLSAGSWKEKQSEKQKSCSPFSLLMLVSLSGSFKGWDCIA
jgi:hypothetical protein